MFEIRDEIEINAPPDKVWATLIDFENYKNWNTQLTFLGGTVQPNGKLHLKLSKARKWQLGRKSDFRS